MSQGCPNSLDPEELFCVRISVVCGSEEHHSNFFSFLNYPGRDSETFGPTLHIL